ncbi:DUF2235 domain-containing protein [Marinibacterium profundimaris]|uniref:DUF2235 domain-containing protein n=1 Tax=Marinibacterium profundimaris TaxID=1679460 RepID=UPI000B520D59|nr:DUF2235 domain-containing protein [Marinibacterium profundimaris]
MPLSPLSDHVSRLIGRLRWAEPAAPGKELPARIHVIILDGTLSTLEPGEETNAGRTYKLCREVGAPLLVHYEKGVQWPNWRSTMDVLRGKGTSRRIRRAYGRLASRYRPGDKVFLFGFSRGAFAVRSLAGVIDMVGLLRPEHATHRNVRQAYRLYEQNPYGHAAAAFSRQFCHPPGTVTIEMVGVWDTVKALGLKVPILWRMVRSRHSYHNHNLGPSVKAGFHALARDETRLAYEPVMWTTPPGWSGRLEQMWFRGTHGDVGGQLDGFDAARPLANVSLVWMLERAEESGLPLPEGWKARYPCDATAPSLGSWRGWAKVMVLRAPREVGRDRSEKLHETTPPRQPVPEGWSARVSAIWSGLRGQA